MIPETTWPIFENKTKFDLVRARYFQTDGLPCQIMVFTANESNNLLMMNPIK